MGFLSLVCQRISGSRSVSCSCLHRFDLKLLQVAKRQILHKPSAETTARYFSSVSDLTEGEKLLASKLRESFPKATEIQVSDVSGGCGAMYQVLIEAPEFAGKRTVMQHRMVNEALKEEIKAMHGLQLTTKIPK